MVNAIFNVSTILFLAVVSSTGCHSDMSKVVHLANSSFLFDIGTRTVRSSIFFWHFMALAKTSSLFIIAQLLRRIFFCLVL